MADPTDPFAPPTEPTPSYRPAVPTADLDDDEFSSLDGPPGGVHPLSTLVGVALLCSPLGAVAVQVQNWFRVGRGDRGVLLVVGTFGLVIGVGMVSAVVGRSAGLLLYPLVLAVLASEDSALTRGHPAVAKSGERTEAVLIGGGTAMMLASCCWAVRQH